MAIFSNTSFLIYHNKSFPRLLFLLSLFASTVIQSDTSRSEVRTASQKVALSAESNWLYGLLILGGILIALL